MFDRDFISKMIPKKSVHFRGKSTERRRENVCRMTEHVGGKYIRKRKTSQEDEDDNKQKRKKETRK